MEFFQMRSEYKDRTAGSLIEALNKGVMTINAKEALQIAEKLERAKEREDYERNIKEQKQTLANSVLRMLREIKGGKPFDQALQEWGVDLGGTFGGYIICESASANTGTFCMGTIQKDGTSTSYSSKEYYSSSGKPVEQNRR